MEYREAIPGPRNRYDVEEHADGKGRSRHGSPLFYRLLEEMADTHDRKSHDYASNDNPYGNYHYAGLVSQLFAHSHEDAGFAGRIAEKIYRLANLEGGQKIPSNESIEDTEKDICVITLLWMADRRQRRFDNPTPVNQSFQHGVNGGVNYTEEGTQPIDHPKSSQLGDGRYLVRHLMNQIDGLDIPDLSELFHFMSKRISELSTMREQGKIHRPPY